MVGWQLNCSIRLLRGDRISIDIEELALEQMRPGGGGGGVVSDSVVFTCQTGKNNHNH